MTKKLTIEQVEKTVQAMAIVDASTIEAFIMKTGFDSTKETREITVIGALRNKADSARKMTNAMLDMGIDKETVRKSLCLAYRKQSKPETEKVKIVGNLSNFMAFHSLLSEWHIAKYNKACPNSWMQANNEASLSNGTMAVVYLLWLASKGDKDARSLFRNQTDLNNEVRKLTGSSKYNNPNSANVFGNFLTFVDSQKMQAA